MKEVNKQSFLRSLPQIDEVLIYLEKQGLGKDSPRYLVVLCARKAVADLRKGILEGRDPGFKLEGVDLEGVDLEAVDLEAAILESVALRFSELLGRFYRTSLCRVINVSGIIIHTNLGRSVLAPEAQLAMQEVAASYSTLEYDTVVMARGSRHSHYEELLCALTGAEAALAVNNNAAAVMMILHEFAQGREVIVSRGELVEIGGSFRVPDIMRLSQAKLIEVGTTNKTHVLDYQAALSPKTSLLLKVHQSNFKMVGFTEEVGVSELRALVDEALASRSRAGEEGTPKPSSPDSGSPGQDLPDELLVYEDQGSGVLLDLGLLTSGESTISESLQAGADLVSFSGDKLLGGPQAGIIVGKKQHVERLKRSPLARALRLDKLSLAALEATLRLYLDREKALQTIPTLRMLTMPKGEVKQQAERLCTLLEEAFVALAPNEALVKLSVIAESAQAGGGSLPTSEIPSYAVCVEFLQGSALECERFLVSDWRTPIICRIKKDCLLCDPRTLMSSDEMGEIVEALTAYFSEKVTHGDGESDSFLEKTSHFPRPHESP
ncbi:MAG: L-seryl-tRNA(Sec) selenium transferase [Coriobacteriia bacterium]|nr:L-seryl-tRNA(Sec) selenium transferase [Coriobacteriia bacterium]MCL2749905.1 L-seryl-tRNA(Sec) selenium transferase [Coriobacteriia bacterium]